MSRVKLLDNLLEAVDESPGIDEPRKIGEDADQLPLEGGELPVLGAEDHNRVRLKDGIHGVALLDAVTPAPVFRQGDVPLGTLNLSFRLHID